MAEKKTMPIVQLAGIAVVIFVAAAGGMYLGGQLGGDSSGDMEVQADVFTNLKLQPGAAFPNIKLLDRAFAPRLSRTILHEDGTIVLFMDQGCPPCKEIAQYWQSKIDAGAIARDRVVGICYFNAGQIEEIYQKYGVDFPIYADESYQFMNDYGVDAFPLMLVVDPGGVVQYAEPDSRVRLEADEVESLM